MLLLSVAYSVEGCSIDPVCCFGRRLGEVMATSESPPDGLRNDKASLTHQLAHRGVNGRKRTSTPTGSTRTRCNSGC